jgi:DNA transformation protein and related proteins
MPSSQSIVDMILDHCAKAGQMSARKMFGEYALYCDEKIVALVCDNQLFLKPTQAGRHYLGQVEEACAYEGAKPSFLISEDAWENDEWLTELIRLTAEALPLPIKRKKTA